MESVRERGLSCELMFRCRRVFFFAPLIFAEIYLQKFNFAICFVIAKIKFCENMYNTELTYLLRPVAPGGA